MLIPTDVVLLSRVNALLLSLLLLLLPILSEELFSQSRFDAKPCERASATAAADVTSVKRDAIITILVLSRANVLLLLLLICRKSIIAILFDAKPYE